ncbi:MAG: T9SS type A sorting domain-containing protein [Bacteroidales bacterium]
MDIYYQINDETPVKETIDLALESYKEKTVYFSNFVSFTADTLKKISIWGTWIEDKNTINDTLSMSLTNLSSATPRYRADPNAEGWLILDQNQDGCRWEKENGVFRYTPNENDADDYLISRHLSLQADTLYNLFLSTKNTNNSESCNLRISIGQSNHPQTKFEPLADLQNFKRSKAPSVPGLMYYIRVPKDGDYAISLHTYGATQTIEIGSISVAKQNPQNAVIDLAVTQIIAPLEDKIFDTNEQIQVKVKNEGKVTAQGANIYCQVNDKIYSSYLDPNPQITAGKEISFTFSDIDLNEVKTHFIKVFTNQTQDANHSNDTLTFTIRSLAIHNVSLLRIQNPSSGMLSNHEQISVWIKNQGKGNIDAIPLELLIDGEVKAYDTLKQSLAQGDSTLFTFVNSFDFSAEKTYQIQIQSQVFSDINRTQDTVYKSVVSTQIPPDAGVSAILEPTDKAMSSTEKIKIQVKNFSKVDLYDIPLVCTAGKEIIKGSIHRLNALDSIIYEFNDPLDLHLVGTHTLVAYTQVDKDANKANDSCHKIVKSLKTDAALMAILSPKSGLNLEQEAIRICIKNTGELSLKNIAVNYLIDSTQVQEIITDSITPQDSLVYIFDRLYNFSDPKTYLLTVWTSVLNDWNTKNDSLHTSIVCQKAEVDAGVVAITSPVSGKLSTQEKISIIVKNFCNTALCNVAVECNVDALNLKGILNKTIAPHDSVSYTFEQSVDMSTKNKYEIAAYTLLPNDINPDNDLYVLSVETLNLESEDASFALLYPNPTHDRVEIQSKNHIQSIAIFNALGQQVFFKQLQSISQYSLSVKDFKAGIYYMNIKSNLGKIQKLKLIIG